MSKCCIVVKCVVSQRHRAYLICIILLPASQYKTAGLSPCNFYLKLGLHYILYIVDWVESPFYEGVRQDKSCPVSTLNNATADFLGNLCTLILSFKF